MSVLEYEPRNENPALIDNSAKGKLTLEETYVMQRFSRHDATPQISRERKCAEEVHLDAESDMRVYRSKHVTCLRCGELFASYDPRYNRRCLSCTRSVQARD